MSPYPSVWYCGQCGRVIPGTEVPDPDACCPRGRAAWADDAPARRRHVREILADCWTAAMLVVAVIADRAWKCIFVRPRKPPGPAASYPEFPDSCPPR